MTKILIVEDDAALNKAYQIVLSRQNHQVDSAFDGQEALQKVTASQPDIILLDLLMPRMNGLEFLRQYKLSQRNGVIIVAFSNLDTPVEIEEAYRLGIHKHLLKAATSPGDLTALIDELVAQQSGA